MRRAVIVGGLLVGACFSDPPAGGESGASSSSGATPTSTSSAGSSTSSDGSSTTEGTEGSSSADTSSGSSSSTGCVVGELDCSCFGNETCSEDLVCLGGSCVPALCGNGMPNEGEDCDDGNAIPGDGCSAGCTFEEQCFVGNFGGEGTIDLASFSITRAGGLLHIDTTQTVGTSNPPQSFSDETSLSRRGRFVYLANGDIVEAHEVGLDGSFPGQSDNLEIEGLLGLAAHRRRPWVFAASDNGTFALHRIEADPNGANPLIDDTVPVQLNAGTHAVVIDFHPELDVAYVLVEPDQFTASVELVTVQLDARGVILSTQVEQLANIGFVRGMRAVQNPTQLLLTGTFYASDGNACFGRIDLINDGLLSGVEPDAECESPWGGYVGILQPNPTGPVIFGTTGVNVAEWNREDDPVNAIPLAGTRHFIRQPWPDTILVASNMELATISVDGSGSLVDVLDSVDLETEGLAPAGGNDAFQAGVLVPCPQDP